MTTSPNSAASSAAQILRDRALVEQVKVNEIMRAELDASLKVEITGPQGETVYARGDFRDGGPVGLSGEYDGGWMIMMDKWPIGTMTLSKFIETEVRVGGIWSGSNLNVLASASGVRRHERHFACVYGSLARFCWCHFQLNDIPTDSLAILDAAQEINGNANANREVDDEIEVNVLGGGFHSFLRELAEVHPTATVTPMAVRFVEHFDKCVIERAKRCQNYSKGSNRQFSIPMISPKLVATLAEALADNALVAQLETNQDIRVDLEASLKVEVTSAAGETIYAQGDFQEGRQRHVVGWSVPMAFTPSVDIPLSGLDELEVSIGGITSYSSPSNGVIHALLRRMTHWDSGSRSICLHIGHLHMFCKIVLQLQGLPERSLVMLEAAIEHNTELDYGAGSHDIIAILNNQGEENPNARAYVLETIFKKSDVNPIIKRAQE